MKKYLLIFLAVSVAAFAAAPTPREAVTRTLYPTGILGAPPLSAPINVQWFGAKGDGLTDDTLKIQAALATGVDVYLPGVTAYYKISATLTVTTAGQKVTGDGYRSKVVQTGTLANSTVFYATAAGYNVFENLYVVPNTTTSSSYDGFGFKLSASHNSIIRNCLVTGSRRGGVGIFDSNYCKVINNTIRDSVVSGGSWTTANDTGWDIGLLGSCSYNLVSGNTISGGCGIGIAVTGLTNPSTAIHNLIENNVIEDEDLYGIMLYKFNAGDSIDHNQIVGNKIERVTGDIPEPPPSNQFNYGAGIYIQTANHTLVASNTIRNTNIHTPQDVQQLPAAIAFSDSSNCIANANIIEDANYYGIAAQYGSAFASPVGRGVIISNNSVFNVVNQGVYVLDYPSAVITGNRIYGKNGVNRGTYGIFVHQTAFTQSDDFVVSSNRVEHCVQGIHAVGTINRMVVTDNVVKDCSSYSIYLTPASVTVKGNLVVATAGGTGIQLLGTCTDGVVSGNFVEAAGGGTGIGQSVGSAALVDGNVVNATTPYSTDGVSTYYRALTNAANPSVKNARWVTTSFTTSITNFDDGRIGQVFTLVAGATLTITDGVTISLNGSTNFTMNSGDTLTLQLVGTVWTELSRSDNS